MNLLSKLEMLMELHSLLPPLNSLQPMNIFLKLKRKMTIGSTPRSFENPYFTGNQEVTMSNLQANDITGHTMADAISSQPTEATHDIPIENEETSEESSSNSKKKWPKFPNGKTFNNGFGF